MPTVQPPRSTHPSPDPASPTHHVEVDWFTRRVLNPLVARSTRWGLSIAGTRVLTVRGRSSGEPRTTVVNVLDLTRTTGGRYLVAPRGATQWARNLRAARSGTLRVGRRIEAFTAVELDDDAEKVDVLRAYLRRWAWEVGRFVGDVGADSSDDELRAAAPRFPVFRIE